MSYTYYEEKTLIRNAFRDISKSIIKTMDSHRMDDDSRVFSGDPKIMVLTMDTGAATNSTQLRFMIPILADTTNLEMVSTDEIVECTFDKLSKTWIGHENISVRAYTKTDVQRDHSVYSRIDNSEELDVSDKDILPNFVMKKREKDISIIGVLSFNANFDTKHIHSVINAIDDLPRSILLVYAHVEKFFFGIEPVVSSSTKYHGNDDLNMKIHSSIQLICAEDDVSKSTDMNDDTDGPSFTFKEFIEADNPKIGALMFADGDLEDVDDDEDNCEDVLDDDEVEDVIDD